MQRSEHTQTIPDTSDTVQGCSRLVKKSSEGLCCRSASPWQNGTRFWFRDVASAMLEPPTGSWPNCTPWSSLIDSAEAMKWGRMSGHGVKHLASDSSRFLSFGFFSCFQGKRGEWKGKSRALAGSAKRRPSLSSPWCGLDPSVQMALSKRFKAYRDPEAFCRHGPRWSQRLIWLQVGKYPCLHLTILHKPNVAWYSWEQAHAEGYRDGADLPLCRSSAQSPWKRLGTWKRSSIFPTQVRVCTKASTSWKYNEIIWNT